MSFIDKRCLSVKLWKETVSKKNHHEGFIWIYTVIICKNKLLFVRIIIQVQFIPPLTANRFNSNASCSDHDTATTMLRLKNVLCLKAVYFNSSLPKLFNLIFDLLKFDIKLSHCKLERLQEMILKYYFVLKLLNSVFPHLMRPWAKEQRRLSTETGLRSVSSRQGRRSSRQSREQTDLWRAAADRQSDSRFVETSR